MRDVLRLRIHMELSNWVVFDLWTKKFDESLVYSSLSLAVFIDPYLSAS